MEPFILSLLATFGVWGVYEFYGVLPAVLLGFWGIVYLLHRIVANQAVIAQNQKAMFKAIIKE